MVVRTRTNVTVYIHCLSCVLLLRFNIAYGKLWLLKRKTTTRKQHVIFLVMMVIRLY